MIEEVAPGAEFCRTPDTPRYWLNDPQMDLCLEGMSKARHVPILEKQLAEYMILDIDRENKEKDRPLIKVGNSTLLYLLAFTGGVVIGGGIMAGVLHN